MEQVILKVEGLSCGHCKMTVEKALKNISGVQETAVDLEAKTVEVFYKRDKQPG